MCRSIDSRTLPQVDERGHRKREIQPHRDAGIDLSIFGDALVAAVTKAGTTPLIFSDYNFSFFAQASQSQ